MPFCRDVDDACLIPDYTPSHQVPPINNLGNAIIMGSNDSGSLGTGWYPLENWPPKVRWTSGKALVYLAWNNEKKLYFSVKSFYFPISITISANAYSESFLIKSSEWAGICMGLSNIVPNPFLTILIEVNPVWIPDDVYMNEDKRSLGIAVEKIWLAK